MEQLRRIGQRGPHLFRLRPRERVAPAADGAVTAGVVAVPMGAQIRDIAGALVSLHVRAIREARDRRLHGTAAQFREDRGSRGLVRADAVLALQIFPHDAGLILGQETIAAGKRMSRTACSTGGVAGVGSTRAPEGRDFWLICTL